MILDKAAFLAELDVQRAAVEAECPDELAGSYRNQTETMFLGMASSDESRIRILGSMARAGSVDPNNGLFVFDLAQHFDNPRRVQQARVVAQYQQLSRTPLGRVERFYRRVIHPSIGRYVKPLPRKPQVLLTESD